ncbi:MAG: hypothetical protein DYH13_07480 [Alphaproteobacteria bacterium PRO2]|nr:hypothetical protein [Alphaproteobacteria bacterium PRO2]
MANPVNEIFNDVNEGEHGWQIRYGAEPIDLHLFGKGSRIDKGLESAGITAGIGSVFNHNYIEILNPSGEVVKRVHGMGLEPKDGKLEMTGSGRLVGLVVDGKYTIFEKDDPVQRDDPHAVKPHNLQHADFKDYTKTVFTGNEREIMEIYGAMIRGSIEINNKDIKFDLFGLNSNTFNAEMREKVNEISKEMGIKVKDHDAPGWDVGFDEKKIHTTEASRVKTWGSMSELRDYIDTLEKTAHEQWLTLNQETLQQGKNILDINLQVPIPPPGK